MTVNNQHSDDFLKDATDAELETAIAENHTQLFWLNTEVLQGDLVNDDGLLYTSSPGGVGNIPFPRIVENTIASRLDAMMEFYRSKGAVSIGCWMLDPSPVPRLAPALIARGFQPGWQPCWMALDTSEIESPTNIPGLHIETDNQVSLENIPDLPYADGGAISNNLLQHHPSRVQRFLAYIDKEIVGQCCLFFSSRPASIAGMYNVGVIPSMQRRGIGKAIVLAACHFAKALGYHYVTLNANEMGRPVYHRAGFRFISFGITWWLIGKNYIHHPGSAALIELATTIGEGDFEKLQQLDFPDSLLNQKLSNGFSMLDIAVHFHRPDIADWLIRRGAAITPLIAWDLGWKDRARQLLLDAAEKDRRYFDFEGTLLHIAIMRNDIALFQLALKAGVDPAICDAEHCSPALGWAQFFGRKEMMGML